MKKIVYSALIAILLVASLVFTMGAQVGRGAVVTLMEDSVFDSATQTTGTETNGSNAFALMSNYDQACAFVQTTGAAVTVTVQTGLADGVWFDAFDLVEDDTDGTLNEVAMVKALTANEDDYICFPIDGSVARLSFAPADTVTVTAKVFLR